MTAPSNYVANVLGDDLIDAPMPVESNPVPVRPDPEEPVLVLYGDREGVTVVVAAESVEEVERFIIRTFGDGVYIDCIDLSVDQRPLSIRYTAGLVPDEEVARAACSSSTRRTAK